MTRFRRGRRAVLVAAILPVMLLGGCGDDESSTADLPATPTAEEGAPPAEARALGQAAPERADLAEVPGTDATESATADPVTPEPDATATSQPTLPAAAGAAIHLLFAGHPVAPGPFLVPVHRDLAESGSLAELLEALAAGPTGAEAAQGLSSALPTGTRVLGVEVADGVATVDLSAEFASGGGSLSMLARAAQVVHTATSVAGVDGVLFELEGEPLTVLGGEGLLLEGPQTRAGHSDLLPPIAVEQPAWGGPTTPDLTITGTVPEGAGPVSWVLVDADGLIVAEGSAEPVTGAGRATFRAEPGEAAARAVSLIVFTLDADGRQRGVLDYPLMDR